MNDAAEDLPFPDMDQYAEQQEEVERVRSNLEDQCFLDREFETRSRMKRLNGKEGYHSVPESQISEIADLKGLEEHSKESRILSASALTESDSLQCRRLTTDSHRDKFSKIRCLPFSLLVAKPVSRNEFVGNPDAMKAYWKEWKKLEDKGTWNWNTLSEWSDVVSNAKANPDPVWKDECHFGYLFGIMVEKGAEFPVGDARRYFKYRVVFQGNSVVNRNWKVAIFQDLGSSPAAMEAGKAADCYGCFDGHDCMQADAEQAYV